MKINVNFDRIFDFMMEADNCTADYETACKKYKKEHGYIPCIDLRHGLDTDKQRIHFLYSSRCRSIDVVDGIIEILSLNPDQTKRLYIANRAVKRWYEKETQWQRCLPEDLVGRLAKFVID